MTLKTKFTVSDKFLDLGILVNPVFKEAALLLLKYIPDGEIATPIIVNLKNEPLSNYVFILGSLFLCRYEVHEETQKVDCTLSIAY